MRKLQLKKFIAPLVIAVLIMVFVGWTLISGGLFNEAPEGQEVHFLAPYVRLVSDCLTISGLMLVCGATIGWIASFGLFDMLFYGTQAALAIIIKPLAEKLPPSFYEYRKQKDEKGRTWSIECMILGGALFLVGMIFVVISLVIG